MAPKKGAKKKGKAPKRAPAPAAAPAAPAAAAAARPVPSEARAVVADAAVSGGRRRVGAHGYIHRSRERVPGTHSGGIGPRGARPTRG